MGVRVVGAWRGRQATLKRDHRDTCTHLRKRKPKATDLCEFMGTALFCGQNSELKSNANRSLPTLKPLNPANAFKNQPK